MMKSGHQPGHKMSLRLRIGAGWPAETVSCDWALLDPSGRIQQSGQSEPAHWPPAEQCDVILAGAQCATHPIKLPSGVSAKRLTRQTMEFSLEEQVLGDTADEHWVLCPSSGTSDLNVLLIERKRLRMILDALNQLGHLPRRVVWEHFLLLAATDEWMIYLNLLEGSGYLDDSSGLRYFFDGTPAQLPPLLAVALEAARVAGKIPARLLVCTSNDRTVDLSAWTETGGLLCEPGAGIDWRNAPVNRAVNLLVDEFAPRPTWLGIADAFRPARRLALASFVLVFLAGLAEWGWLAYQWRATQAQMVTVFQSSFPAQQTIVDPYRQMRTQLDVLRRSRGLVATSDFSALLLETGGALGTDANVVRVQYESNRLEFEFVPGEKLQTAATIAVLARRGLKASVVEGSQQSGGGSSMILRIAQ